LETTIALAICALVRLPVTLKGVAEAYVVTMVATLLLLPIGNLTSLYSPRAVDPAKALRPSRGGRVQALMLVVYPVVAIPLALAYGARYAFNSEVAFFAVLGLAVVFGMIVYRIAMESAVTMAESKKEAIVSALSRGEGPVE
jgi:ABC-2 type transport system permease protein